MSSEALARVDLAHRRAFKIPEAARQIGCSRSQLYREAKRGNIKISHFGGCSLVTAEEINRVLRVMNGEAE